MTYQELLDSFLQFRTARGAAIARRLVSEFGSPTGIVDDVPERNWKGLALAFGKATADDEEAAAPGRSMLTADGEIDAAAVYAKYNSVAKR